MTFTYVEKNNSFKNYYNLDSLRIIRNWLIRLYKFGILEKAKKEEVIKI